MGEGLKRAFKFTKEYNKIIALEAELERVKKELLQAREDGQKEGWACLSAEVFRLTKEREALLKVREAAEKATAAEGDLRSLLVALFDLKFALTACRGEGKCSEGTDECQVKRPHSKEACE